jgi:hypothetical protein
MGFFGNLIGSADTTVLQNGTLGRGEITNLQMSGMTLQAGNGLVERKCTITANVYLDNTPMFVATITQRVQEIAIPQLSSGGAVVAMYALQLTAYEGVDIPYQLTVGNPVPATALPLLFPGSKLHAKLGDDPNSVVVDWAAGAAT